MEGYKEKPGETENTAEYVVVEGGGRRWEEKHAGKK